MKKLFIIIIAVLAMLALSQNVFSQTTPSGIALTNPVQIESIAIIGVGAPIGHLNGNMEIKIKNGFSLPAGVKCDTNYITTKRAVDPDRAMLSLLRDAYNAHRTVQLYITDDSIFTAYPGRCSIIAVSE
ncbi:MAG: hypothetical protein DYG89_02675 [Caldilinea sp. CFX5]|nr:hypothetical protein [Caldilinea sp. CFX5]